MTDHIGAVKQVKISLENLKIAAEDNVLLQTMIVDMDSLYQRLDGTLHFLKKQVEAH